MTTVLEAVGYARKHSARPMIALFAALCFAGGVASLNYQIAWQRLLTQEIGIDTYSVTIIVGLFMAGLGIGGYLSSFILRSGAINLALTLGAIEIALGAFGIASAPLIQAFNHLLLSAGISAEMSLAANFVLLLSPTILMGITTPLMVTLFSRYFDAARATAFGYASNIAGAAVGTLLSGFVLIGGIGIFATCAAMGAVDVLVGVVFVALARRQAEPAEAREAYDTPGPDVPVKDVRPTTVMAASFIIGFFALGSEVIYFRLFTTYFGPTPYVFPTLLFAYLTNMTIGTFASGFLVRWLKPNTLIIGLIGATLLASLPIQYGNQLMLDTGIFPTYFVLDTGVTEFNSSMRPILRMLALSVIMLLPVACLSALMPILVSTLSRSRGDTGKIFARLYFVQTAGNTLGCLVIGFVFYRFMGTIEILQALGVFLAIAAGLLVWPATTKRAATGAALAALVAVPMVAYNGDYYNSLRYPITQTELLRPIRVWDDAHGMVLAYPKDADSTAYSLMSGGKFYVTGLYGNTNDHLPLVTLEAGVVGAALAFNPEMQRILFLGVGTAQELLAFQRLPGSEIDVVELLPAVVDGVNELAFSPIRRAMAETNVYVTDGRRFLMHEAVGSYDYVHIGVDRATTSGAGNLFSQDFLEMIRARLTEKGVVSFVAYPAVVKAALQVYPEVVVLAQPDGIGVAYAFNSAEFFDTMWNNDLGAQHKQVAELLAQEIDGVSISVGGGDLQFALMTPELKRMTSAIPAATDDLLATEFYLNQRNEVFPGQANDGVRRDLRVWEPINATRTPWSSIPGPIVAGQTVFQWKAESDAGLVQVSGADLPISGDTYVAQLTGPWAGPSAASWHWQPEGLIRLGEDNITASFTATMTGRGRWGISFICDDNGERIARRQTYAEGTQTILLTIDPPRSCTSARLDVELDETDGLGFQVHFTPHGAEVFSHDDPLWRPVAGLSD
jgi:spermidine synthase